MALRYNIPKYSDRIGQDVQVKFGGLDRRLAACDGAIRDMMNMCGDEYPLAMSGKGLAMLIPVTAPCGIYARGGVYYAANNAFYKLGDDTEKGSLTDTPKRFACLGDYIVILPDKKYYRISDGTMGTLEASWSGTASFADGTYAGEEAEGCRIVTTGTAFPFGVGDAVTISGAKTAANNQTIIIREISDDKKSLGFYEHSFTVETGQTLTIERKVPDMDFICENENRLWGCKGSEIYASKPGDPFNWNVFDGLASDSYAVSVGSAGDFTACVSYLGYPIFFKEDQIYKVYGSKPSNYQVMASATLGVAEGSSGSLAIAGEILYYHSKIGIMAYSGGIPQCVSEVLGNTAFTGAVGGSDGEKYYVSMAESGVYSLYIYDTGVRQWYRVDSTRAVGFAYDSGAMYVMSGDNRILKFRKDLSPGEAYISSELEFADFVEGSPNKKSTAKLLVRVELEQYSSLKILMSFDGGAYTEVATLMTKGKESYYLPILIRRCDRFRIKFQGSGIGWRLYSLTREYSEGSAN